MDNVKEKVKQRLQFWSILYRPKNKKNEGCNIKCKTIKDIIQLATDEVVIKDYYAATVKKPS
jgi:hypothetical protein